MLHRNVVQVVEGEVRGAGRERGSVLAPSRGVRQPALWNFRRYATHVARPSRFLAMATGWRCGGGLVRSVLRPDGSVRRAGTEFPGFGSPVLPYSFCPVPNENGRELGSEVALVR
jgi:hypothetical protein